ncbi:hypothetical protein LY90DRAFT_513192 [Neocallimastix californiae]|uniref:PH domain-containing protein n=1 Tax=Neocallimastix californiae TaxID=1754190 RepID=A0A1Y2B083_9FUNG|nr:hypothetical protein LY90DRAFT_513192 [Neocallimastix californiae]|eukprot:ORY28232.1 hypothetical protein LY90DRAFT_513192 [Neocallimastix californiae]
MSDNIQTNLDIIKDDSSSNTVVNNTVNKIALNKSSSSSLLVKDEIKKLNKTPSFSSETSSKSNNSIVKSMLKFFENQNSDDKLNNKRSDDNLKNSSKNIKETDNNKIENAENIEETSEKVAVEEKIEVEDKSSEKIINNNESISSIKEEDIKLNEEQENKEENEKEVNKEINEQDKEEIVENIKKEEIQSVVEEKEIKETLNEEVKEESSVVEDGIEKFVENVEEAKEEKGNIEEEEATLKEEIKENEKIEAEKENDEEQGADFGFENKNLDEVDSKDDSIKKESIISQLSQVITSDSEAGSISDQANSVVSSDIIDEPIEEESIYTTSVNPDILKAIIKEKENEYKTYVEDITDSEQDDSISEVHIIEEVSENNASNEFDEYEIVNDNNGNYQPLKAEIIELNSESEASDSIENINSDEVSNSTQPLKAEIIDLSEEKNDQDDVPEVQNQASLSDDGCLDELNGFTSALKSIDEINNAEKQFLIPNSEVMEKMINKSLQQHNNNTSNDKTNSLNLSSPPFTPNSARESLEVSSRPNSLRNSYQSHSSGNSNINNNLHLQISPPQPPPDAPLPPTPHGTQPPTNILSEPLKDSNEQNNTMNNNKGHMQHYSLGRLTEFSHDEDDDKDSLKRISNRTSHTSSILNSYARNSSPVPANRNSRGSLSNRSNMNRYSSDTAVTDNSIIRNSNSNIKTVTVQTVDPSNPPISKKKKIAKNKQPLQAVVYKIDSDNEETDNNDEGENSNQEQNELKDKELEKETQEPENQEKPETQEKEVVKEEKKEKEMDEENKEEKSEKTEASKTSSKKLKDTFSNIENLLDDLDNHIQSFKTPRLKAPENDGYEGDDEYSNNIPFDSPALSVFNRNNGITSRNSSVSSSLYLDGSVSGSECGKPTYSNIRSNSLSSAQNPRPYLFNDQKRPVSEFVGPKRPYYTNSLMSEESPMTPESVHDVINPNDLKETLYSNILKGDDDEYMDIDQSLNNNLKMLKNSKPSTSGMVDMSKNMNINESSFVNNKALNLVGVENQAVPNMNNKALKMLGMKGPSENEFTNLQFDEKELSMLNAAQMTNPHSLNKINDSNINHNRQSSGSSQDRMMMNMSMNMNMPMDMNMNMNMPMNGETMPQLHSNLLEKDQFKNTLLFNDNDLDLDLDLDLDDEDDELLMGNPDMLAMGSLHSNNSFKGNGNTSFSMSQKALKVFGISENELKNSGVNGNTNSNININRNRKAIKPSPVSPYNQGIDFNNSMSTIQQQVNLTNAMSSSQANSNSIGIPSSMDNFNLSRYSIKEGDNQINGVISSKALKIIGVNENSSKVNNLDQGSKSVEIVSKKALENRGKKIKEWEEVDELIRVVTPTLASLKPILTDYLYFNSHSILKGWKKRFIVLTQDNYIYYFNNNDPKGHARASIPINSETTVNELFDPISVVPYFMEITSISPDNNNERRFIIIGCDNKQKCQSWITTIKSIIARDKFSNAKLPPKPVMEDDEKNTSSINISNSFSKNKNNNINSSTVITGDLGSLYDEITGYSSNTNNTVNVPSHRSRSSNGSFNDFTGISPILSPKTNPQSNEFHKNVIKKNAKNIRVTKHPARKESFRPHYANIMTSPTMAAFNASRSSRLSNAQSTIPMVSSSPLMKSQASSYTSYNENAGGVSPNTKGLNNFNLTSPAMKPIPSITPVSPVSPNPLNMNGMSKMGSNGFRRSPLLSGNEGLGRVPSVNHSPLLSPTNKPMESTYLQGQNQMANFSLNQSMMQSFLDDDDEDEDFNVNFNFNNNNGNGNGNMNMNKNMNLGNMNINYGNMEYDKVKLIQQQKMQEQLIKQQQQQIMLLQQQLLQSQKEKEKNNFDMSKDRNFY